ncbi:Lipase-like PAD4, partial [Striga hermonthica]
GKVYRFNIGSSSCENVTAWEVVEKLNLPSGPHPHPYTLAWIQRGNSTTVDCRVMSLIQLALITRIRHGAMWFLWMRVIYCLIVLDDTIISLFMMVASIPMAFSFRMQEVVNDCKSVVFTGHSVGGAVASLSALWLLSTLQSNIHVLCVTFGSPMLGNQSLSRAVLHERWAGHFIHVVAQNDLVPFAPFMDELRSLLEEQLRGGGAHGFWPFGSYMLCKGDGAICLDNGLAIVRLLYLMMVAKGSSTCVGDHLEYEAYVGRLCWHYLLKRPSADVSIFESTSQAGTELALRSSGLDFEEPIYGVAKNCLTMARQVGCSRNLNAAKMAVSLSKVTPLRAQIEWYKALCDEHTGYYDSFKRRGASKRDFRVNLNRIRLAIFWDNLLSMLNSNQLTHDFHKLPKYVNASRFYTLLVEPLEIAEYYRTGTHKKKGHYMGHGREKRFKIFDRWWAERKVGDEENGPRSRFASLTQDSCFWARVEEARDYVCWVESGRHLELLGEIWRFERYARGLVERKEVSVDVLAKNSSYRMFVEEWEVLRSRLKLVPASSLATQEAKVQEIELDAEADFVSPLHDCKMVS